MSGREQLSTDILVNNDELNFILMKPKSYFSKCVSVHYYSFDLVFRSIIQYRRPILVVCDIRHTYLYIQTQLFICLFVWN